MGLCTSCFERQRGGAFSYPVSGSESVTTAGFQTWLLVSKMSSLVISRLSSCLQKLLFYYRYSVWWQSDISECRLHNCDVNHNTSGWSEPEGGRSSWIAEVRASDPEGLRMTWRCWLIISSGFTCNHGLYLMTPPSLQAVRNSLVQHVKGFSHGSRLAR